MSKLTLIADSNFLDPKAMYLSLNDRGEHKFHEKLQGSTFRETGKQLRELFSPVEEVEELIIRGENGRALTNEEAALVREKIRFINKQHEPGPLSTLAGKVANFVMNILRAFGNLCRLKKPTWEAYTPPKDIIDLAIVKIKVGDVEEDREDGNDAASLVGDATAEEAARAEAAKAAKAEAAARPAEAAKAEAAKAEAAEVEEALVRGKQALARSLEDQEANAIRDDILARIWNE